MRRETREMALCSVMAALGTVLLFLGGVVPMALYACPMLASMTLLPVREGCRKSYCWCCFGATAALGLLLGPDKEAAMVYCFLGWYPLVKPRLDALRVRGVRLAAKLALCAVSVGAMYGVMVWVLRLSAVIDELEHTGPWLLAATAALGVVLFLLYDVLLTRLTAVVRRRRKR